MAGITKNPVTSPKIKRFIDETFHRLCRKYKSPELQAGFEVFRNELISGLKHEKMGLTPAKKRKV